MKTKKSFYSKFFLYSLVAFSIVFWGIRSFGYEWSKTFGGSEVEVGESVQQTADGGYIVAGSTSSFGAGGNEVYLIKTDGNGNEQWSKTFGGSESDWGNSVQQTADGGYVVAGSTSSFGAGSNDVYLIKTDSSGNEQWSKTFGGSRNDKGHSVQQTADGGYIVAGFTSSFGAGSNDVYLIKTDSSGNEQWSKTFGGSEVEVGESVQRTADGGFIIAGFTYSFGAGSGDFYLIKTDGNGNEQWSKTFGGSKTDYGKSVQQTTDGGFIIAGRTSSFGAGSTDVYLIKTDGSGNEQWSKTFGASGDDWGKSVQQTTDGGFIIVGSYYWFEILDGLVYLIKTDGSGNEQWSKTFGGREGSEGGTSVQQTTDGGFIIAGYTYSFGAGEADVYLIYYKPDVFADVLPGSNHEASIYAIYNAGITTGCAQNPLRFCPQDPVTRAQMAAFIIRALEGEPPDNLCPPPPFPDVDPNLRVCKYIKRLSELEITTGYPDGTYRPYNTVTRAQMAAFIVRAKEGEPPTDYCDTGSPFPDVDPNSPTCKYIKRFFELGITTGYPDGTYRPGNNVTRRQMAAFLDRAFLQMD